MTRFPRPDYEPLSPYAPDRVPIDLDLSDNTNLRGAHPDAAAVLREIDPLFVARYPTPYADSLRAAVARRFGVPEECVATGCGSDALIDEGFRAVGGADGMVAFPSPTFVMVPTFARMNGLESRAVLWADAVARPEILLEGGPSAVYVCTPNNPTGMEFDFAGIRRILELGGPDGPPVFLDEAYADFAGRSMIREAAESDRLVVLRTLSKAYGLAGLRVGFAVGAPQVIAEMEKSRGPYKVSRLAEPAAAAAVADASGWLEPTVEELNENRVRLAEALAERGLETLPSAANFLFVLTGGEGSARALTHALRDRGVGVRPFPALDGVGDGFRVSVAPWSAMERFLSALDASMATVGAVEERA